MRIFIAGATGTLGRPVVQLLLSHGHDLVGLFEHGSPFDTQRGCVGGLAFERQFVQLNLRVPRRPS